MHFFTLIIVGTIIIIEDIGFFNFKIIALIILHIVLNLSVYFIYESFKSGYMFSGVLFDSLSSLYFWLVLLCTCGLCLVPFYLVRGLLKYFADSIASNLNKGEYYQDYMKKKYIKMLEELNKYSRSIVKFKKIFKTSNFQADNFADKRMKDIVDKYKQNKRNNVRLSFSSIQRVEDK